MKNISYNIDHDMAEVFKVRGENICKRVAFIDLKEIEWDDLVEVMNAIKIMKGQEG